MHLQNGSVGEITNRIMLHPYYSMIVYKIILEILNLQTNIVILNYVDILIYLDITMNIERSST